jgi:Ca-activated chloride channel family protein
MNQTKKNRTTRNFFRIPAFLLAACLLLHGGNHRAEAAGLLIADGGFGGTLEIVEHDVRVTLNNGIAVTEVTQVFQNMEKRQVEALYTFPVPKGASVSNFSMWINGKEMIGEVLEKERAREIYNSYKKQRRDPGLLEQKDYKTFEMRIFPIAAEARQKVQIVYYQELDIDHDWATYVYPLATTTHQSMDNRVHGRFSVSANIKSAIPISTLESPSHGNSFLMVNHAENYHEASLENRDGDLARDVVLAFQVKRPVTGLDLLTSNNPGEDGYFALTLTAGQELEKMQTGADYVFILDISGSMADDSKLSTSVNSLEAFIKSLGPDDRFELITFNKQPNPLFNQLSATGMDNIEKAVNFLKSQEARGGTSLQPALTTAYKYSSPDRPLNTVILSDGMTEQDERRILLEMIKNRPGNTRVFCIGVGNNINRSLLSQLAEDAGGLAAFLSRGDDFTRQAKAFRRKLMHPVATNIGIRIDGVETYDVEPRTLPNLYHGAPVRIYGRYRGQGAAGVKVAGEVNGRSISTSTSLIFPAVDENNPEIERMWAWHRMEQLKRIHETNNDPKLLDEIVRLGEAYSITSQYTSFLVLENDGEYQRWKIDRRNATRIKRDRKAQLKLQQQLEAIRNKALNDIGPLGEKIATNRNIPTPAQSGARPATNSPLSPRQQPRQTTPSKSVDMPSFGGGAMDPVSALLGIFVAGGAFFNRRKKK